MNLRTLLGRPPATERPGINQPVEVGQVEWLRDLDQALEQSSATGKPVFALFQEVPGCAGCKQFGRDVLSNPVVVDGIEEAFVPLLIHNNTPGRDAQVLAAFGEPAWNYQVVRFLDDQADDIIPRRDRVWDTVPLVNRMVETLTVAGRSVPAYLRLIEQEHAERLELVHFAQSCFWVGEMELGQIEGVVATEAAFMGGHEVTSVWFDPQQVSLLDLSLQAQSRRMASVIFAGDAGRAELEGSGLSVLPLDTSSYRVAPGRDQKHQIRSVRGLDDLSISQLTKVNAFFRSSAKKAAEYLAPSQRALVTGR